MPGVGQVCRLRDVESRYATPRMMAGEGVETDIQKCALKPQRRSDYYYWLDHSLTSDDARGARRIYRR